MLVARRERKIEWGDCDPAKIVYNPRFFDWFDNCTGGRKRPVSTSAGCSRTSTLRAFPWWNPAQNS